MKILKQPSGYDFEQPLLNKLLRVHATLMHTRHMSENYQVLTRKLSIDYYDAKTRSRLDLSNWRVKLIRKFGT